MKTKTLIGLLTLVSMGLLNAQSVPFTQGTFATDVGWTGTGTVADGKGKIGASLLPVAWSGDLASSSTHNFLPNSLYEVSVDIADASGLVALGSSLSFQVLDGNGVVVSELSRDQLLNLLGIAPLELLSLTDGLNLLGGGLTGDLFVVGTLRDLLGSLPLDPITGDLLDPALLGSLQGLVESLVGADNSVVTQVTGLLNDVLGGEITDVLGNPLALADLLGGGGSASVTSQTFSVWTLSAMQLFWVACRVFSISLLRPAMRDQ